MARSDFLGRRVLLVDDDDVVLRAWARELSSSGATVETSNSAQQATRILKTSAGMFDAIVLDDRLGDGCGLDLVPLLQKGTWTAGKRPVLVVVTAHLTDTRAVRAFSLGVPLMPKPQSPGALLAMLDAVSVQSACEEQGQQQCASRASAEPVCSGALRLDADTLHTPEGSLKLRRAESLLLHQLMRMDGGCISVPELCRVVLHRTDVHAGQLVRRHVSNLRASLRSHGVQVEFVRGAGYRLR